MKNAPKNSTAETETSKFLSYILRHQPEAVGLTLDSQGWADIDELLSCAAKSGRVISRAHLDAVVINNDKKRFCISDDGRRIRAVQGHSSDHVNISYASQTPPDILYHGTAGRFLESIRSKGLLPGSRQYVHLSADQETAHTVGKRHGKPVVLKIRAADMAKDGFEFHQADNGVWLTRDVPPDYIE